MAKLFTPEELEELRRADAELDEEYTLSKEDIALSRSLDRDAKLERLDNKGRKIAARNAARSAAYREANREQIAARHAAWQKKNREKWNAYQRAYRAKKKAASDGANIESGRTKNDRAYDSTEMEKYQ